MDHIMNEYPMRKVNGDLRVLNEANSEAVDRLRNFDINVWPWILLWFAILEYVTRKSQFQHTINNNFIPVSESFETILSTDCLNILI